MPVTDALLANNATFVANGGAGDLPIVPSKHLTIITCMDSRIDVFRILGLAEGEAHVLRNAGGVVTDDMLRSLIISQRLLQTQEVIIIHHTDCGMVKFKDDDFREELAREVGEKPQFAMHAFSDVYVDVRECVHRVVTNPFVKVKTMVRGFVYDVVTGKLEEVSP